MSDTWEAPTSLFPTKEIKEYVSAARCTQLYFAREVEAEVARARGLWPDNNLLVTAFSEEAGEVVKAVLDHLAEKGTLEDIRKELIQAAAMIVRLLEEGDPTHGLPPTKTLPYP